MVEENLAYGDAKIAQAGSSYSLVVEYKWTQECSQKAVCCIWAWPATQIFERGGKDVLFTFTLTGGNFWRSTASSVVIKPIKSAPTLFVSGTFNLKFSQQIVRVMLLEQSSVKWHVATDGRFHVLGGCNTDFCVPE